MVSPSEDEVIARIRSEGSSVANVSGQPHDKVFITRDWSGSPQELADLKQVRGIKEIWVSGVRFDDLRLEDLPELEQIVFCRSFFDSGRRKQVMVQRLPIKTIRLDNLPKVSQLDLTGTDASILHLTRMTGLIALAAQGLEFGDGILLGASACPSLVRLAISRPYSTSVEGRTRVTDAGLAGLSSLQQLESLQLDGAKITDDGLVPIGRLTAIQSLGLSASEITDHGIGKLAGLSRLTHIALSGTKISGTGLREIVRNHPRLTWIAVDGTRVAPGDMESLRELSDLNTVTVDTSQLNDESCRVLSSLPSLVTLCVTGYSSQPGIIQGLPDVQTLYLEGPRSLRLEVHSVPNVRSLFLRDVGPDVTCAVFRHFAELSKLQSLELSRGWHADGSVKAEASLNIDDELMKQMVHLSSLKSVSLENADQIGDDGVKNLARLSQLQRIVLPNARVTDAGMEAFAGLTKSQRAALKRCADHQRRPALFQ